jgi:hypothetical protein
VPEFRRQNVGIWALRGNSGSRENALSRGSLGGGGRSRTGD